MSKPSTLRVSFSFVEADRATGLARIAVIVEDWSDAPTADPISISRATGNLASVETTRLAVVEKKNGGWQDVAVAEGKVLVHQLGAPEVAAAHRYVRWVVHVETNVGGRGPYLVVHHPRAPKAAKRIAALDSQLNRAKPEDLVVKPDEFPRLSLAINATPVAILQPPGKDPALGHAADIATLLTYVYFRLRTPGKGASPGDRPDALAGAWAWASSLTLRDELPAGRELAYAEEAWARKLTELVAFCPYAGPGEMYFGNAKYDSELLAQSIQDDAHENPVFGLVYACQHLVHFGVASRGRKAHVARPWSPKSKTLRLLNAGASSATTVDQMGGAWIIGKQDPKEKSPTVPARIVPASPGAAIPATALKCDASLTTQRVLFSIEEKIGSHTFAAGALFVFGNRPIKSEYDKKIGFNYWEYVRHEGDYECTYGGSRQYPKLLEKWLMGDDGLLRDNQGDGAHVGMVLRTDKARKIFQCLDTGGLHVPHRGQGVTVVQNRDTGNYDDPHTTYVPSSSTPLRGVGVWTPMTKSDAVTMDAHVRNVLAKARPLGLARLVIMRPGVSLSPNMVGTVPVEDWCIYASPLRRMYEDEATQNFAISRYLWSLRGVPRGTADVWWFIYVPRSGLARAMIDGGRSATLSSLARKAFDGIEDPKTLHALAPKGEPILARVLAHYTVPLVDIKAEPDGTAEIHYRHSIKTGETKSSAAHYAEAPDAKGEIRLPMDRELLASGEDGGAAGFPTYFRGDA